MTKTTSGLMVIEILSNLVESFGSLQSVVFNVLCGASSKRMRP